MDPECSLLCLQQPSSEPCRQPDESNSDPTLLI
jgi:hypothetical protein